MVSPMPARTGTAHVVTTTRKYKDQVYRTHLLRRSFREDGVVKNETLGNLSHLPDALIEVIRRSLQGETFVPLAEAFAVTRSAIHGPARAVDLAMQRLGFAALVASKSSRERDLVMAMVAARIIAPHTKLATTRWWHTSHTGRGLRRGRCQRGRVVRRDGLAAGTAGRAAEEVGRAPSQCGWPGAL